MASAFSSLPCFCLRYFCYQCIGGSYAHEAVFGVEQHSWHQFWLFSKYCVLMRRSSVDAAEAAEPSLQEEWGRHVEMKTAMVFWGESFHASILNQTVASYTTLSQTSGQLFLYLHHRQILSPIKRSEFPLSNSCFNIAFQWSCKMEGTYRSSAQQGVCRQSPSYLFRLQPSSHLSRKETV